MKTLKRKMFWTLYGIFSLLTVLVIGFNMAGAITNVRQEIYADLMQTSRRMEEYSKGVDMNSFELYGDPEQPADLAIISSSPVYTFLVSRDGTLMKVLYYSTDSKGLEKATRQAEELLHDEHPGAYWEGSLFSKDFAWTYSSARSITLMDVRDVYQTLLGSLFIYLLALIFFEIAVFFICRMVVSWMIEPVEKAFDRQKQFIADASHELKTPLAVITANAEEMKANPDPKWLDYILEETKKMSRLVTDLLDLTRSEQAEIQFERISFSKAAEKECAMQEVLAFEKGKTLETEIQQGIEADVQPDQLMQVFGILLDNAIKHADQTIVVKAYQSGNKAVYAVENDGPTIPADQQEKIFERFYRADASRNRDASRYGLGLAIARNIANNHSGSLTVASGDGKTVFTFRIPVTQKNATSLKEADEPASDKIKSIWKRMRKS